MKPIASLNRRQFIQALMAGGVVVAGNLWMPGEKLISIPRPTHVRYGKTMVEDVGHGWYRYSMVFNGPNKEDHTASIFAKGGGIELLAPDGQIQLNIKDGKVVHTWGAQIQEGPQSDILTYDGNRIPVNRNG